MANGNGSKLKNGLSTRAAFIVAIVSAVVGGISGPVLLVRFGGESMVRPDPYTGSQAQQLESRVDQLDRDVVRLQAQYDQILRNQDRIIRRLDTLNGQ